MTHDCWGQWCAKKHYSLQIVQHPLRARMCGFGDKDRRPLAPAAVAKLVVRREDNSIVDVDELDASFFLVTVDLWSADGKREMNLVLHPSSSTDRYVATVAAKPKKSRSTLPPTASPSSDHPSPPSTPNSAPDHPRPPIDSQPPISSLISTESPSGFPPSSYSYTPPDASIPDPIAYPPYNNACPDPPHGWSYPPHLRHSQRPAIPSPPYAEHWNTHLPSDPSSFRSWPAQDPSFHSQPGIYNTHDIDTSSRPFHPSPQPDTQHWNHHDPYSDPYPTLAYTHQSPQTSHHHPQTTTSSPPLPSHHPLPRHVYTRTLVGPLSCNACRLLDENRIPGIFFLFQDLSVRTEGTFRLRLRLMNVGDSPSPEAGALRVHTHVSPVLAQTFTDPFVVFSAKRFPGVPETTALSIAFGNQGQKLPLRNRHSTGKHGRRPPRDGDSEGSESSDDT